MAAPTYHSLHWQAVFQLHSIVVMCLFLPHIAAFSLTSQYQVAILAEMHQIYQMVVYQMAGHYTPQCLKEPNSYQLPASPLSLKSTQTHNICKRQDHRLTTSGGLASSILLREYAIDCGF